MCPAGTGLDPGIRKVKTFSSSSSQSSGTKKIHNLVLLFYAGVIHKAGEREWGIVAGVVITSFFGNLILEWM